MAGKLIAAATAGLKIIFKPGYRYKKAGVTFLDLVAADQVQSGLFDRPDDARSVNRMHAIDALNGRFGSGTVTFVTVGVRPRWGLRREFISQRYTTVWEELLCV
jgi:DNA polymerase V